MKVFKDNDEGEFMIVRIIVLTCAALFTYYGFFETQPCDLDAIYLSCRLTGSVWDWIGCFLFYTGCVFLIGIPRYFGLELYNPENSSAFNIITFVAMAIGIILIWA